MGQAGDVIRQWFTKPDASLYADDIDWYVPGYPVPQDRYLGRAAVVDGFFPALRAHFRVWRAVASQFIEAGEAVTVIGEYFGTSIAGVDVVIPFLHVWTVRDGKINSVVAAANTAEFARAIPEHASAIRRPSTPSQRSAYESNGTVIPAISTLAVGPLGVMHLARFWLKNLLYSLDRLPADTST